MEDEHINKRHNKTLLLYHLVFPAKYRRKVLDKKVSDTLKETCVEISERYEINFLEIGTDEDHVHFLVQSVPTLSITRIISIIVNPARLREPRADIGREYKLWMDVLGDFINWSDN